MFDEAHVRSQLAKILASAVFVNSPRMRRFLTFVVEESLNGRASQIKEYAIAIEVFGKRQDYDSRTDSTVRTEATKLRARLDRYYAAEGAADTLVISLPKGSYAPLFREVAEEGPVANNGEPPTFSLEPSSAPGSSESHPTGRSRRTSIWAGTAAVSIVVVVIAGVWLHSWVERQRRLVQLEAKGSVLTDSWSNDEILRGIEYFRQVVSLDPKSASAYSAMASSYVVLSDVFMAPRDAMPRAALAANKAIGLNRRSTEAHIALGMVKLQFDWDWRGAQGELRTALALSPAESAPHQLYGWYLMAQGRFKDSLQQMQDALALDPSSDFSLWELGLCYYFSGRYDDAAEQYRRAMTVNPKSYWAHMLLGWTLEQQGKFDDAISEMAIARQLTDTPQAMAALAQSQAVAGKHAEAERLLRELTELSKQRYVSPYDIATIYAGDGETERTLTYLEKAYEDRSGWLPLWLKIDPKFNAVRSQERFSALLKRVEHDSL